MFIAPMLLEKREEPFDDDRYVFEPKIDGHRLVISLSGGRLNMYTRHGNEVTRQYPELHDVPTRSDIVLDGEVACVNSVTGAIEFESVMERFKLAKEARITEAARTRPVHFFAFDVLSVAGRDVRNLPLTERKAILNESITNNPYFSRVLSVEGTGRSLFDVVQARRLEGIVAKRKDSAYVSRRSAAWLKVINYEYADVYIAGWRKEEFGWLAQDESGRGVGIVELAVPVAHRKAFYSVARALVTGEDRAFVYVEPRVKVRVRFRNWTSGGRLRTPEFVKFIV
ncbi:RNA ligase family protein [Paenibacillus sp. P22]|uniref:ATP-dependent DNA ligase n=1 Tax=Paenibacillus sp. P22 TaxID=483908 RepID=UPI000431D77C|nr:RNA ligase family protein [Paenibacillus sp. P22]CDN42069.1 SPBc2 prophage-derived DNA ligase-like protein LigB [Paenibacillus sp. P22]